MSDLSDFLAGVISGVLAMAWGGGVTEGYYGYSVGTIRPLPSLYPTLIVFYSYLNQ